MTKPELHTIEYLDWHAVKAYIKEKYERDPDNWDGNKKQCIWNYFVNMYGAANGQLFCIHRLDLAVEEVWQAKIYDLLFEEFSEYVEFNSLTFRAAW